MAALAGAPSASAADYYVDASAGDDGWTGQAGTPTGARAGPWKTLGKVASTAFQPGDRILLKCGEIWRESLTLRSSGTPEQPIEVKAYPASCAAHPIIDGSIAIPASDWVRQSESIYQAPVPQLAAVNEVRQVFSQGDILTLAHYPNRGHKPSARQSLYLETAQQVDLAQQAGSSASTYLLIGSEVPPEVAQLLSPGITARVRVNAWTIDERAIVRVAESRLYFDRPASGPIRKGWGYYLTGALWMLDEPGEWHYDKGSQHLHVWMPDGLPPGSRVTVPVRNHAVNVNGRSYVVLDGLAMRQANHGVLMRDASNIKIRNSIISDTVHDAVDASGATSSTIEKNEIIRAGRNAIYARVSSRMASKLSIVGNNIRESGLRVINGTVGSLPSGSYGAIMAGTELYVANNRIAYAAQNGIIVDAASTVAENYVTNPCLVLDDCAAIYVYKTAGGVISRNIIVDAPGAPEGRPASPVGATRGIYLDDLSSGFNVSSNTVVGADDGIMVHNAFNNDISGNKLYRNRRSQIWLSEGTRILNAAGDLYGNKVLFNQMFAVSDLPPIGQSTRFENTFSFAIYDHNIYAPSALFHIARERSSTFDVFLTMSQWRASLTQTGMPREMDLHSALRMLPAAPVSGVNLMSNGNFEAGTRGWHGHNRSSDHTKLSVGTCEIGRCLEFSAGGAMSQLSSPHFSIEQGQWYRVSFDLRSGADLQPLEALVRRRGEDSYERLTSAPMMITAFMTWQRFTFMFKVTKTSAGHDRVTRDIGARLVFERVRAGEAITLANVELVQIRPIDASTGSALLLNETDAGRWITCDEVFKAPGDCTEVRAFRRWNSGQMAVSPWASRFRNRCTCKTGRIRMMMASRMRTTDALKPNVTRPWIAADALWGSFRRHRHREARPEHSVAVTVMRGGQREDDLVSDASDPRVSVPPRSVLAQGHNGERRAVPAGTTRLCASPALRQRLT